MSRLARAIDADAAEMKRARKALAEVHKKARPARALCDVVTAARMTGERLPVYKGASFDLWEPDRGLYYAWADPETMLSHLQNKRVRSGRSPFSEFDAEWLNDPDTLPCLAPRIAFRDVTRSTDSRTVRCALLPPNVFVTNQVPICLWPRGDERDEAYLLGVLSSLPLDWYARRFVETHVNYHVFNPFPVPRPGRDDPLRRRAVELSGRLACPDDCYAA